MYTQLFRPPLPLSKFLFFFAATLNLRPNSSKLVYFEFDLTAFLVRDGFINGIVTLRKEFDQAVYGLSREACLFQL